ncbi:MAG: hypothetical protein ABL973_11205 [Micropepsaceae bacterium]
MSLLVGSVEGDSVWMVSDAVITGGTIELRDRVYELKIVPSLDGMGLAGFAGDTAIGSKLIFEASDYPSGAEAVEILRRGTVDYPSVDFGYAFRDDSGPHLIRISGGEVQEVATLHLGIDAAFSQFQRIRHSIEIDPAPLAITKLLCAVRGHQTPPNGLPKAIGAMQRLFAERPERDVGGWAVPYVLTGEGARLCSYSYSVSDPILDRAAPGALIGHGTAEAGGFNLSVTELGSAEGLVVYWVQGRQGVVFRRSDCKFECHRFSGSPSAFKLAANQALNISIDLWFGDTPAGPIKRITIMHDQSGRPAIAVADHGNCFTFSALQTVDPFQSTAVLPLNGQLVNRTMNGQSMNTKLGVSLSDDAMSVQVRVGDSGADATEVSLSAQDLDKLMFNLSEVRSRMLEQVSREPCQPGTFEIGVIDPAWRTQRPSHPGLNGIELRLRHVGLGWVCFILPYHEARNLGTWLVENAPDTSQASANIQPPT